MTAQSLDQLEYEGRDVFCHGPDMPANHPRVRNDGEGLPMPTSMLRGYRATWALRQEVLYLLSVWGQWSMLGDEPVPADWVTGEIAIPVGAVIGDELWGPVHERTLYLQIATGRLVATRQVKNAPPPPVQDLSIDE